MPRPMERFERLQGRTIPTPADVPTLKFHTQLGYGQVPPTNIMDGMENLADNLPYWGQAPFNVGSNPFYNRFKMSLGCRDINDEKWDAPGVFFGGFTIPEMRPVTGASRGSQRGLASQAIYPTNSKLLRPSNNWFTQFESPLVN